MTKFLLPHRSSFKAKKRAVSSLEAVVRKQKRKGRYLRYFTKILFKIFLITTFLTAIVIVAYWVINQTVLENEKFRLSYIEVAITGRLRKEKVIEWASIPSEANLITLDIQKIQTRLLSRSEIGEAQVQKILPNKLVIKVIERRPVARLVIRTVPTQIPTQVFALDKNGVIITPRPGEDFMRLPEIIGANLREITPGEKVKSQSVLSAIDLIVLLETSHLRPKLGRICVDVSKEKTLRLSTPGGGWAILSRDPQLMEQQIARLAKIMEYASARSLRILSADLTVQRNVPVRFVKS